MYKSAVKTLNNLFLNVKLFLQNKKMVCFRLIKVQNNFIMKNLK